MSLENTHQRFDWLGITRPNHRYILDNVKEQLSMAMFEIFGYSAVFLSTWWKIFWKKCNLQVYIKALTG